MLIFVNAVSGRTASEQTSRYDEEREEDVVEVAPGGETFTETAIPVASIRSFSARKPMPDGTPRVGTRIVFNSTDGGRTKAIPVRETFEEVKAKYLSAAAGTPA